MRVVFLEGAEDDLKDLRRYVVHASGERTWQAQRRKLQESVRAIVKYPGRGVVPGELAELDATEYRQVICGMNRVIYAVRNKTVYVYAVWDTRRSVLPLLYRRLHRTDRSTKR